jgi:hypothetical protein
MLGQKSAEQALSTSVASEHRKQHLYALTGLVPVIPLRQGGALSDRDGRHKAGHDEKVVPKPY